MEEITQAQGLEFNLDKGESECYAYFRSARLLEGLLNVKVTTSTVGPLREFYGEFTLQDTPGILQYTPSRGTELRIMKDLDEALQSQLFKWADLVKGGL